MARESGVEMTTIAVRGREIAADWESDFSNMRMGANKIFDVHDTLVGIAGNYTDGLLFIEWLRAGADRKNPPIWMTEKPDFVALQLCADGAIACWNERLVKDVVLEPFWAIGSGAPVAMGAMHMGASAERAVEIAALVNVYTGRHVQVVALTD